LSDRRKRGASQEKVRSSPTAGEVMDLKGLEKATDDGRMLLFAK
jgi:hypothetical protein